MDTDYKVVEIKRSVSKRVGGLLLVLALIASLGQAKHFLVSGFSLKKVMTALPDESALSYLHDPALDCASLLDQPFYYLGKGGQAFVFRSLDGKRVIKLIRFDLLRPSFWAPILPSCAKIDDKRKRYREAVKSYHLAFDELREMTGVEAVHLTLTHHLRKTIHLVDGVGQHYFLPADKTPFILQRRVELFGQVLQKAITEGNIDRARSMISSYTDLLGYRLKKGIYSKDHNYWARNYGVDASGKLLEIDVGSYRKDAYSLDQEFLQKDTLEHTKGIRKWISEQDASLAEFFNEAHSTILAR